MFACVVVFVFVLVFVYVFVSVCSLLGVAVRVVIVVVHPGVFVTSLFCHSPPVFLCVAHVWLYVLPCVFLPSCP